MSIFFDHETNRIKILFPTTEITIQEIVDAARLEEDRDLTKHVIIEATGKQVLSAGVAVGITLLLTHDWQIEWWPGNYTATISGGNLVAENGDPIAYVVGGPQVEITLSAAATITTAGGATPTAQQIADAVWAHSIANTLLGLSQSSLTAALDAAVKAEAARIAAESADDNATLAAQRALDAKTSADIAAANAGLTPQEATKLDEIHRIHGLKAADPLVVTPTTRTAGSIAQDIAAPVGATVITRR